MAMELQSTASIALVQAAMAAGDERDFSAQTLPPQHMGRSLVMQSFRVKPGKAHRLIAWKQSSVTIAVH